MGRQLGSTAVSGAVTTLGPWACSAAMTSETSASTPSPRQLAELDRRLAEAQAENSGLQARLSTIEQRPLPAPTPPPDTNDLASKVRALLGDPPPAIDPRRVEQLEASNERLQLRVAELASTLTNQLSELGGELDAIERSMARRLQELEARVAEPPKHGVSPAAERRPTVGRGARRAAGQPGAHRQRARPLQHRGARGDGRADAAGGSEAGALEHLGVTHAQICAPVTPKGQEAERLSR